MNTQNQAPDLSAFRETTSSAPTEPANEEYKRILPNKEHPIPDVDGGRFLFRIVNANPTEDFRHGMKFWLNVGKKKDGTTIAKPFVSALPFQDFLGKSSRGGVFVNRSASDKGCKLSQLADQKHPLIALNKFRPDGEGSFKPNVDPFHACIIQLIELEKDAKGGIIMTDGRPKFKVLPEEYYFEFRQAWWDQWVNLVTPQSEEEAASMDDGLTEDSGKAKRKPLPTADMTKIVWMLWKEKRVKNKTGNPKLDIDYLFDFSDRVVLTDADIPKSENAIESFEDAYPTITDKVLDELLGKANQEEASRQDSQSATDTRVASADAPKAEDYGEEVPVPAGAGAGQGQEQVGAGAGQEQGGAAQSGGSGSGYPF